MKRLVLLTLAAACSQNALVAPDLGHDFAVDLAAGDLAPARDLAVPDLAAPVDAAADLASSDRAVADLPAIDLSVARDLAFGDLALPDGFALPDLASRVAPACASDPCTSALLAAFEACFVPEGVCAEVTPSPGQTTDCWADQSSIANGGSMAGQFRTTTRVYTSSSGATCARVAWQTDITDGGGTTTISAGGHTWTSTIDPFSPRTFTCDNQPTACHDLSGPFPLGLAGLCPAGSACP